MILRSDFLAIILAAGKGSRLDFSLPKPLYKINGIAIIDSLIDSISKVEDTDILTVVGYKKEAMIKHISNRSKHIVQNNPRGTGHALMKCLDHISRYNNVFVFVGDAPLINSSLIRKLQNIHLKTNSDCSFLYSNFPFKLPYARLIFNEDKSLNYLVESNNANKEELDIKSMFTSHYLFNSNALLDNIDKLLIDKNSKEYNLTDLINIYIKEKLKISPVFTPDFWRLMGVNTLNDARFLGKYQKDGK